nr:RNA polymerase sigma-70 factor [Galbibacter mesophilus]
MEPVQVACSEVDADALFEKIVKEDDLKSFEELYNHYFPILCNYVVRFVASKEIAQDLISDLFFKFWKNRKKIKINSSVRAYFFTSAKNTAYNYLSREYRKYTSLEDSPVIALNSNQVSPEGGIIYDELSEKIKAAINELSPQCKKVFLLSRNEGLKYREIADRLNISNKAVEANMSRALKSLKFSLKYYLSLLILFFC